MQSGGALDIPIGGITGTKFDQIVVLGQYGHAIGGPRAGSSGDVDFDPTWRENPEARAALGPVGMTVAGHPSIFPTTWVTTTNQISLRIPRTPTSTEIWWFSFTDRRQPKEVRDFFTTMQIRIFGPAGVLEQEDGENWGQATVQTHGVASRRVKQLVNMGVGRGKVIKENGLARIDGLTSEYGQLWTYHSWAQWMKGLGWDELRDVTTPPDVI
jgi:3-phenylpropionate/trans-cinnamate dioxygenase alpha subunit